MYRISCMLAIFICTLMLCATAFSATYYVSPWGDDSNTGASQEKPFQAVQHGIDQMEAGDTLVLLDGFYRESFQLKSGITLEAKNPRRVILSGAAPLTASFERHTATIYKARVDKPIKQLFFDDKPMIWAQWPDMQWSDNWDESKKWALATKGTGPGVLTSNDFSGIADLDLVGGYCFLRYGKGNSCYSRRIEAFDGKILHWNDDDFYSNRYTGEDGWRGTARALLTLEESHVYHPIHSKFFLAGDIDLLNAPGEWFVEDSILYFYPPDGMNPNEAVVFAKTMDYCIDQEQAVSDITIDGMDVFAGSVKFAAKGNSNIRFHNTYFTYPGGEQLYIDRVTSRGTDKPIEVAGSNIVFERCLFAGAHNSALNISGSELTVRNCVFMENNRHATFEGRALGLNATGAYTVTRNTFVNNCSDAIRISINQANYAGSVKPDVSYNNIFNAGKYNSDVSGIYMPVRSQKYTEIHHNWMHNVKGNACRLDVAGKELSVHHNVFWQSKRGMSIEGYGQFNIYNNTDVLNHVASDLIKNVLNHTGATEAGGDTTFPPIDDWNVLNNIVEAFNDGVGPREKKLYASQKAKGLSHAERAKADEMYGQNARPLEGNLPIQNRGSIQGNLVGKTYGLFTNGNLSELNLIPIDNRTKNGVKPNEELIAQGVSSLDSYRGAYDVGGDYWVPGSDWMPYGLMVPKTMAASERFAKEVYSKSIVPEINVAGLPSEHGSLASELKGRRPNIMVLIPDDISFGSLSAYGGKVPTPHLDNLKAKGISFENFHVSPSCAPTRAALMTGRHEFYAGVTHTINMRDRPNLEMRFLPEILKDAGYATGMFGKWHLGDEKVYQPDRRGFDEVYMHGGGGIGQRFPHSADFPGNRYNDPVLRHNDKVIRSKGYCTNLFHEQAMKWMKQQAKSGQPFFCYLPANVVHTPMYPPRDEYLLDMNNTYGTGTRPEIVNRILKNYDNNVGRMMEFLGQEGLLESTLVIFLTDNGSSSGNRGFRGGKLSAYDGGSHVPCFFYWKGVLEGGLSSNKMVAHMDFFLTFADLAGQDEESPGTKAWDGRSMLPILEDLNAPWPARVLMTHCGRWKNGNEPSDSKYTQCAVKDERFQLVNNRELYDLVEDPGQKKNVMEQYPGKAARLRKSFDAFWEDVRPRMINEQAYKDGIVQPYFDLFKGAFGEEAFKEADARGQVDREEYNKARRSRMNNRQDVGAKKGTVTGELKKWHPVTVSFKGPDTDEMADNPNPFLDYRLQVLFTGPGGQTYDVPGFYDGDGQGNGSGNVWKVLFTPDQAGEWSYKASFRQGSKVAVSLDDSAGSATGFDGASGIFNVAPLDKQAPGFLSQGRLESVGKHYFKFRDGTWFLKGGADSPENFLGYQGIDNTPAAPEKQGGIHTFSTHVSDWKQGDPDWGNGKAKGIIGALNYLSTKHVNSLYVMLMNIGGDGQDVFPFAGDIDHKGSPSNDNLHYDISKLRQWGLVFDHAQSKGINLHYLMNEAEPPNKKELDNATLGVERKLFYREMTARFGHHNALTWNLCEEYNYNLPLDPDVMKEWAAYVDAVNPYGPIVTLHHLANAPKHWGPFVGDKLFGVISLQTKQLAHVESLRSSSAKAGHPVPVSVDEFYPDGLEVGQADAKRKRYTWPILFSGASLEYISNDLLKMDDFKIYEQYWDDMWTARKFMIDNLPFWEMEPADDLLSGEAEIPAFKKGLTSGQVFAKQGDIYAVYLPNAANNAELDLTGPKGIFEQGWFNPRSGTFEGSKTTISGGQKVKLGFPPNTRDQDWVTLVERKAPQSHEVWTPEPGFVSLFNGRDLSGWCFRAKTPRGETKPGKVIENFEGKTESDDKARYSAKDGILTVRFPEEADRLTGQLYTVEEFSEDFVLKLEFRASVNADSGVFLRKRQLQCRDYLVAGPFTELKRYKPQDWNLLEVTVKDSVAHCTCNGEVLIAAYKLTETGPIGLEGDRGQMEYRHLQLKKLP